MPETQLIPTVTIVQQLGSNVNLRTSFFEPLPNTVIAQIMDSVGNYDSVPHVENLLLITMINYPSEIHYSINSLGELLVATTTGDESNYSIDANGDLIYTT